ncbi:MAG: MBL fold metallo-hydrolase [Candidatus Pacebacteria bacterium]|nr:MBL fold metallo-hydrolase [Candidatus Paceibacterota bacterium]
MSTHTSKLSFRGGTGSVTGANFLLDTGAHKIVIDCGLTQGENFCSEENYGDFTYVPSEAHALLVTHAHMDHIGRIPQLVRRGFMGPIYSTEATKDLARAMFKDAVGILAGEARLCHKEPLYEAEDVEQALTQWKTYDYHEPFDVADGVRCTFKDAGHILGSALVFLERAGKQIVFSGDLGNSPDVLLHDTESIRGAHYLVMESVYGDRAHEGREVRREVLKAAIEDTRQKGGVLLIPSFSLQRTQVLLSEINVLIEDGAMQPIPIFLDSPLAIEVLDIYRRHSRLFNDTAKARMDAGDDLFDFPKLKLTRAAEDSSSIESAPNPKVIIAGSGMSHGGRIRSHEKRYLGDKDAAVLFVGYQTVGSLGRRIKDGAEKVKIDGDWVKVRARVSELSGYSAHKDRDALISFVETAQETLQKVFVVMGEPKAALFLTQRLRDFLGVDATAPAKENSVEIDW